MTVAEGAQLWWPVALTVAVVLAYELWLRWFSPAAPDHPGLPAREAHAGLREAWFHAMGEQAGSELLAVQTLRNSLMSATLTGSTAALALMGTVSLALPMLKDTVAGATPVLASFSPRVVVELLLMAVLFAALACSTTAVRYFNHAGFIVAMPVGSPARQAWRAAGAQYVRRAGVLYGWGLRALLMVAPLVVCLVHPTSGPLAAIGLVLVLRQLDRVQASRLAQAPQT